jgi:hypothetical protein
MIDVLNTIWVFATVTAVAGLVVFLSIPFIIMLNEWLGD